MNCAEFLHQLRNCQRLTKNCAPFSLFLSQEWQCYFSLGMFFHLLLFVASHRKHNRVTLNEVSECVCALIFPDIMGSGKTNCTSSYINLFRVIVEAGLKNLITFKSERMRQSILHRVNWLQTLAITINIIQNLCVCVSYTSLSPINRLIFVMDM